MCVQKNETLKKSWCQKCVFKKNETLKKYWYQNFPKQKVSKMCVHKNEALKKSWCQKCVFKKMKLSKIPDIKISLHRRSQKCVTFWMFHFFWTHIFETFCVEKFWYQVFLRASFFWTHIFDTRTFWELHFYEHTFLRPSV